MSVIELHPRPSVRAQLVGSHDLLDLGEAMCNAGNAVAYVGVRLARAGRTVIDTCELPTEADMRDWESAASQMLTAVQALRLRGILHAAGIELPADCEPVA